MALPTNLLFTVHEGPVAHINTITVVLRAKDKQQGLASDAPKPETLRQLTALNPGELFSRAKLIQAQRNLAESGLVNPKEIAMHPQPNPATGKVNIDFVVTEK
jgi:outer membrane protein assembly factor BamA